MTRRVWGYVNQDDATIAAYFVEWTPGHSQRGASFDLIIGKWGEGTAARDRKAVALVYHRSDTGRAFTVIDAENRPIAESNLVSEALGREEVIGKPIAKTVFAICDTLIAQDHRLADLLSLYS